MLLALTLAVVGLVIAWGWQALGGLLALVYTASGPGMTFTAALLALPLLSAGLLHLVCSVWTTLAAQPGARAPQAVKSSGRVLSGTARCRLDTQKRHARA